MWLTFNIEAQIVRLGVRVSASSAGRIEYVEYDAFDFAQRTKALDEPKSTVRRVRPRHEPLTQWRSVGETLKRGVQVAIVAQVEQADATRAYARPC